MGGFYHLPMGARGFVQVEDTPVHSSLAKQHQLMSARGLAHMGRVPMWVNIQSINAHLEVRGKRMGATWTPYTGIWRDGRLVALSVLECMDDSPQLTLLNRVELEVLQTVQRMGGVSVVYVVSSFTERSYCVPWSVIGSVGHYDELHQYMVTGLEDWGVLYE